MTRHRPRFSVLATSLLLVASSCQASLLTNLWSFATQRPAATNNPNVRGDTSEHANPAARRVAIIGMQHPLLFRATIAWLAD